MTWYICSIIRGESTEPRAVDGQVSWPTASEALVALDRYCDLHGYDPDDFVVVAERE